MKMFRILYLLILTGLFGCNTLVTKPVVNEEPSTEKTDKTVYLFEPYRIDKTTDLTLTTDQNNPATFFWKTESTSSQVKPVINRSKNNSHKRIKNTYPTVRTYTAKQKLAKNTPSIGRAIAKAIKIIPEKKRFNNRSSTSNLWDKVRKGYAFKSVDNNQVQREINKFLSNPSYFQRISRKANPYFYHIVKEVENRGLPMELALLPAIESAFEPRAVSHKSAAGLWQFMPATGRYYGLTQNKWYDGRRDIAASTNAALNYLKTLHNMFNGDWFLALAAYNYGEGNVGKAIRRNAKNNRPTDFWSLKLPRETREYVPKLLAFAKIVSNPKAYGVKLQRISNQPYFKKFNVGRQIELSVVAQLAGTSVSELKLLNPCYRRGITSPKGPYNITLPASKIYQFKQRLAQIPSNLKLVKTVAFATKSVVKHRRNKVSSKKAKNKKHTKKTSSHRVRKGDTLWKIAKRYKTTIAKIKNLNKLGKRSSLKIGQRLVVSAKKSTRTSNRTSKKTKKHRVRQGDNWWKLAKRYGTTVSLLKRLNRFKSNSLRVGKFLVVPN
ncbi:LysM peptidoglycan-binding domain-containing protein [Candidatus Halobeggiatoa sp. HSG11]|nr:LysM peptidoglycan-binding domain-containing protein [Candidatus Halobeggiatoa sp. HSG11]